MAMQPFVDRRICDQRRLKSGRAVNRSGSTRCCAFTADRRRLSICPIRCCGTSRIRWHKCLGPLRPFGKCGPSSATPSTPRCQAPTRMYRIASYGSCRIQGALCHLTLQMSMAVAAAAPDTAETEWLDRHGRCGSSIGRTPVKLASLATGAASFQGLVDGTVIAAGTELQSAADMPASSSSANPVVTFETLADVVTSSSTTSYGFHLRARSWCVRQHAGRHHPWSSRRRSLA